MSNEMKIKIDVELDDSKARSQINDLKALGEGNKINLEIDLGKVKGELESLSKSLKNAFKMDSSALNDINKLSNALKELNKAGDSTNSKSNISGMVNEYKTLANTVEKLQKQMNKGIMGEDSVTRTTSQISKLKSEMEQLYSKMDSNAKQQIDLFNTKQATKGLADMNQSMTKIESTAASLQTKLQGIDFSHVDTSSIERLQNELKEIQNIAKQDINLDLDTGNILSDLNRITSEIKNLEKVENLASSFDRVKSSISGASSEVESMASSIKQLESIAGNLDGSFDKAFSGLKNNIKDMESSFKSVNNSLGGSGGLLGTFDDFKSNFSQFTLAEVAGDFIADGIRTLARGVTDTIVETDRSITSLMKVAPESFSGQGEQLKSYLTEVQQVAKGTGQSSAQVIEATAGALQTGIKTMDGALKYAEQVAIYANTGDLSQDVANQQVAAIMSSFGGVENSLKPVREQIQGASKDYSTLAKYTDLANYIGEIIA